MIISFFSFQDNDRKHTSKSTKKCIEEKGQIDTVWSSPHHLLTSIQLKMSGQCQDLPNVYSETKEERGTCDGY